ncbi:MAG: molybdopterin-dependent oxidoreductase [Coriobacteriaceae bacterium]|nr:molybdopterin-dependent oxidoreductase [Coriobacteriaceae bacterium]
MGETKHVGCVFCDGGCVLAAETEGGEIKLFPLDPKAPAICSKATMFDEYRNHPGRLTAPLKNTGRRGEPVWEEISWDQALDEIAERLKAVIEQYGPEAIGVSEMPLNHGFGGLTRRLMNALGAPNYIAPIELCMGNTAQVCRTTLGYYVTPMWDMADLVVYFGQNRGPELWPAEYLKLKAAQKRGAKLIVVDPRRSETAEQADVHLPVRYGTDAALMLGWINVIINERLYDAGFVKAMTVGFDELAARAEDYPPDKVAAICGIDEGLVRETARMYAAAAMPIIPWGATCDMQRNSTSAIRCQCILRALVGAVNKSELVFNPASGGITNSEVSRFDLISPGQRSLQLGHDTYPLLSFATEPLYRGALAKAGIDYTMDVMGLSCSAHPTTLFEAMRSGNPYPVKAFLSLANNTAMSYAGMQGIVDAFMNQELVVVFETFMTPTAQLADYVLPGDMWAERDVVGPPFDVAPLYTVSQKLAEPAGQCKDHYFVMKGLADRLGFTELFPWKDSLEYFDWLLKPLGLDYSAAQGSPTIPLKPAAMGTFLTPSGKIELKSSVLESLGHDPLPYYCEHAEPGIDEAEFPYVAFAGARDKCSYNTALHQMPKLRAREPEPELYINPLDLAALGLGNGQWAKVSSTHGTVELVARPDERQPAGTVRIPHGWWKPEASPGLSGSLSAAMLHNDGMVFTDAGWNLDPEQGLANLRGGIRVKVGP